MALTILGQDEALASLETDTSALAQRLRNVWAVSRDAVLADHPWNFAEHRAVLAPTGTTPEYDWTYEYVLPVDPYCLRVLRVGSRYDRFRWRVEGRTLLTDAGPSLNVLYIKRVDDLALWSPKAAECLAIKVASRIAFATTGSTTRAKELEKSYKDALPSARSTDGMESGDLDVDRSGGVLAGRGLYGEDYDIYGGGWS